MELFDYKLTYEKIASLKAFKCSHCNRIFSTQVCNGLVLGRVPLLMPCSHTICEECIIRMAKDKKIDCKVCNCKMTLENPEKWPNLFPVDRYMFGALLNQNTLQTSSPNSNQKVFSYQTHSLAGMAQNTLPKKNSNEKTQCSQDDCNKVATMMCMNCCGEVYCTPCDKRVHKSIRILKNHVRYPIDVGDLSALSANCSVHSDASAEYYCFTCKNMLCSKCIIKDHSGHDIISIEDKNVCDLPAFKEVMKKGRYLLKSMETTVKEVNMEITNSQKNFKPTQTEYEIIKHFSMLHSTLQILEASMLDKFYRGQASKINALHRLSEELTSNIEILQPLVNTGKMLLTNKNMDKLLISELLGKIEENLKLPCEIIEENSTRKPKLKFITDNSILEKLQQHCSINVEESFSYKLIPKSVIDVSKFEDEDSETFSIASDSTTCSNRLKESSSNLTSSASSSSSGIEGYSKKKPGCRTRLSLSGSEPTFHPPANQPKKEKQKNEQTIKKGMEYNVYVSHITSPSLFYVQLSHQKKFIEDLTKKYANYAETAVIPTSIEHGKVYIVQYSDEKCKEPKWYRGRVNSTLLAGLHNLYEVFFVDYGNTSFVTINKIREIKNVFTQNPNFAHQCRLHGITSLQDTWNNNVLKDMVEFISCFSQHDLKMYVVDNDKGILDVSLFSHVASISEFLIIAGYAQHVPDVETNARRTFNQNETKISLSIQNFQKGQKYIVSVSHIINPLHMYVRVEQYKDVITNIETGMTGKYNKSDGKYFIFNPNIGMCCAALLTIKNESKWRRAEIIEVPCNGMIKVFAIDYGITEYVEWRCIRKLHINYRNVDAQAIKITLTHVIPNSEDGDEWPLDAIEFLRKQLDGKITSMVVDQESRKSLLVTLYECHQEEDVCINALLVQEGYALSTGEKSQQLKLIKDTKVEYYRQMSSSMIMDDKYWVAIEMVHIESPGCFYVIPLRWSEKRDKFTKELVHFYADEKPPEKKWTIDSVCIVKSKEDNLYYRAIVTDTLKSDRYKVFMKDIIRTEIVSAKEMYTLEDQFGIHDFTIKCRLGGMIPTGGEKTWPHSAREYFNQILELYTYLYITQSEPVSDKILPVELIAKWEDNNGPLNAASVHKAVINSLIIEAGLAIPVKIYTDDSKLNESDKIEPLKFQTIKVQGEENEPSLFLGPKPTSWLKPYRLQDKKFQAWPSYVDHDGFIYIHTAKTKSMLSNVRRVLGKYFKAKPHDKNHVWKIGDMCTVQYHLDKSFCRGTVTETTADGKIHVQLIDYGNVEECTPEELRTDVLMTDQPPLTIKCALANVTPKTKNNKWPITILDTLHMTIVEKECEAFLENEDYQDDQMPEVTLIINHICINTTIMTWDWGKIQKEVRIADEMSDSEDDDEDDDDDDDDKSVIVVDSSNDGDANTLELDDADVVLEKEIQYTYVQLPENIDAFEGAVVNFIDYLSPLIEPDFIQKLMKDTADQFEKMLLDINQFAPYLPKISEPVVGLPCIALFGADHFWYRAEILNIDRKEIKVLFVDYGNVEIIPLDDIKEIKEEWLEFSVQMLKCKISGIQLSPLRDNLEAVMQMKEEVEGKHVVCKIQKYQTDIEVKLMCKHDPQTYAYQKLIDENYILECN